MHKLLKLQVFNNYKNLIQVIFKFLELGRHQITEHKKTVIKESSRSPAVGSVGSTGGEAIFRGARAASRAPTRMRVSYMWLCMCVYGRSVRYVPGGALNLCCAQVCM